MESHLLSLRQGGTEIFAGCQSPTAISGWRIFCGRLLNFTARYAHVRFRDSQQRVRSAVDRLRKQSLPAEHSPVGEGFAVGKSIRNAVGFCQPAGRVLATIHNYGSEAQLRDSIDGQPYRAGLYPAQQRLALGQPVSGAKEFSTVQQDLQSRGRALPFNSRYLGGGGNSGSQSSLVQDLSQIGQSLSSTSLAGAQPAYASLQQQLQEFELGGGATEVLNNLPLSLAA